MSLPELDVFGGCLFAFGDDDRMRDGGGCVVVNERQSSDGWDALGDGKLVQPPRWCFGGAEIILIDVVHAVRGYESDEALEE